MREKSAAWKLFANSNDCEAPNRMQIQRRVIAFRAMDPDDISMRYCLMLRDALGKCDSRSGNNTLFPPFCNV